MPLPKDQAWFPAKTYGWGWGLPSRWQGWVVMGAYVAALVVVGLILAPRNLPVFVGCTVALSLILTAVCYAKGEAPRWRWGDDQPPAA